MNHNDLDFLTIENVAKILHVSKQTVSSLIKSGEIKVIKIEPRSRRIEKSDARGRLHRIKETINMSI